MEVTESVSKGCFVFQNGFKASSRRSSESEKTTLFGQQFVEEPWYTTFKKVWRKIERRLNKFNTANYRGVVKDLVNYVEQCFDFDDYQFYDGIIPSATLLLGINQPDHRNVFISLKQQLQSLVTPHVVILQSQDCNSVKQMIESMVFTFLDQKGDISVKKYSCTMSVLKTWYNNTQNKVKQEKRKSGKSSIPPLVVVISDFESFNSEALQDFIQILSGYTPRLPFVLIFGVATSVSALHKSFPYQVSSKLNVQIFQSHSSTNYLNKVLDELFLTHECPFQLSGKIFQLIVDVFLFYDFSVSGFIQNIKFCMMEQYYSSKIMSLCCRKKDIDSNVDSMDDEVLESIRRLPSFRPYVESNPAKERIALLINNEHLKAKLKQCLHNYNEYTFMFYKTMHILLNFIQDLPNSPLGKQIRELYPVCMSSEIVSTAEYKQCLTLLNFLSKQELIDLINRAIKLLENFFSAEQNPVEENLNVICIKFDIFMKDLQNASMESKIVENKNEVEEVHSKMDRHSFKKSLIMASQKEKSQSEFDVVKHQFLDYLTEIFKKYLQPPSTQVFHELFVFDDIYKVKKHIIGAPRASVHTGLNNPATYLQCDCCELTDQETIMPTMPDLSIVYKLHLECGKLINLYDWMQAFVTIVDPVDDDEERREINPKIQARFTRAVAELQFLGFIKSSRRKTDHVTRLTW